MKTCGDCPWRGDPDDDGGVWCLPSEKWAYLEWKECPARKAYRVVRDAHREMTQARDHAHDCATRYEKELSESVRYGIALEEELESLKADNTRMRNLLGEWNDE